MKKALVGYRNTLKLIDNIKNYNEILPEPTVKYFEIYRSYFN